MEKYVPVFAKQTGMDITTNITKKTGVGLQAKCIK
jgi:hypothetical protein